MNYPLIINDQDVRNLTPIGQNIDTNFPLKTVINMAQDKWIRPVLCDNLYFQLLNEIETNTLTAVNIILRDQCKLTLAWYTALETVIPISNQLRPQGIVNGVGDTFTQVDMERMVWLRNYYLDSADIFSRGLQKFLMDNIIDYPLYNDCKCNDNNITLNNLLYLGEQSRKISVGDIYNSSHGNKDCYGGIYL